MHCRWGLGGLKSALLVQENNTGQLVASINTPMALEALIKSLDIRVSQWRNALLARCDAVEAKQINKTDWERNLKTLARKWSPHPTPAQGCHCLQVCRLIKCVGVVTPALLLLSSPADPAHVLPRGIAPSSYLLPPPLICAIPLTTLLLHLTCFLHPNGFEWVQMVAGCA